MKEVAIISVGQTELVPRETRDQPELVQEATTRALDAVGLQQADIGFTCSGSSDYLGGKPFTFVAALDGIRAWPPISESHVEMDGAWALYEAWVKLQIGHIDTALVYSFGKPSTGDIDLVMASQFDPYTVMPLWPDATSVNALQARALLDASDYTEADLAEAAMAAAWKGRGEQLDPKALFSAPYQVAPLRAHDSGPSMDGAAAVILATGDRARQLCERPAWIRGIDHRVEPHQLGLRDLAFSESTQLAARAAGVDPDKVDVAELYAPTSAAELIIRDAIGLDPESTDINPSGGALAKHTMMVSGLLRFVEAASRIMSGAADCAVAHATSGPALQQNMVAVLEGT